MMMRKAFQFHHLTDEAKKVAENNNKGLLLTQFLYNKDGTNFDSSTTVYAYKNLSRKRN